MERSSRLGNRCCVSGGVVVDETMVAEILRPLFDKTRLFGMVKPYVLACTPSDATREERERLYDAVMMAGASSVWIIPEPLAAAVGAGIDVSSPYAQMVVDIGEGVTDCAVIKMSRMQATAAVRVGCSQMRVALAQRQAATGTSGHPGSELEQGLYPALHTIIGLIDDFLKNLRPEEGCEVIESGILLTGGGALIPGLRGYLEQRFDIAVRVAPRPITSVVEGAHAIVPVVVMLNLLT